MERHAWVRFAGDLTSCQTTAHSNCQYFSGAKEYMSRNGQKASTPIQLDYRKRSCWSASLRLQWRRRCHHPARKKRRRLFQRGNGTFHGSRLKRGHANLSKFKMQAPTPELTRCDAKVMSTRTTAGQFKGQFKGAMDESSRIFQIASTPREPD